MSTDFDFNLLQELANNAPVAGYGPRVNFGLVKIDVVIVSWKDGQISERPFKKGETLKAGEYLRIVWNSDLSEFNPAFTNPYKRQIDVKRSGTTAKTDFSEIFEPAARAVLGQDYFKKLGKGVYLEWEDAETVEKGKDGLKRGWWKKNAVTQEFELDEAGNKIRMTNSVPRVLRVFKSKAECEAARAERFGSDEFPVSDDADEENIPAKVISDAKGIWNALDNDKQARELFATTAPYDQYDTDALIAAIQE